MSPAPQNATSPIFMTISHSTTQRPRTDWYCTLYAHFDRIAATGHSGVPRDNIPPRPSPGNPRPLQHLLSRHGQRDDYRSRGAQRAGVRGACASTRMAIPQREAGTHDHRHRPDPRGPDRQLPCRPRRGLPRAHLSGLPGGAADRDDARVRARQYRQGASPAGRPGGGARRRLVRRDPGAESRPCGMAACWA